MSKIIVIGANHAGTAAINTILDNYEDDVVVFDGNSNISFLGCGMALWIGKQIDGPEGLFYSSKELLEEKGAIIYMETIVEHVDYEKKIVYAKGKDGKEYQESYDKLNQEVMIEIVYDEETRRILGCQMASKYDISMGIHMFSLAIQEHLTIDKLALLDIFFLPHFNQPYNYITMAGLTAK